MQTKNINLERTPQLNNEAEDLLRSIPEKTLLMLQRITLRQHQQLIADRNSIENGPPLPPRSSVITYGTSAQQTVSGEEHVGPYKPVPPPKPLAQTPPPYRMPPYPLFNEPSSIPGTALDQPIASSSPVMHPQGSQLQTHSNKFPVEREVILTSSGDKNTKIPILNEYMKRSKQASIAPDAPPKQMAAWTSQGQMQGHQILPDQTHSGLIQTIQQVPDNALYRATAYPPQDYYNLQGGNVTPTRCWDPNKATPRPYHSSQQGENNETHHGQQVSVQIEQSVNKENKQVTKGVTKTYHTLKDIISSRFRVGKDATDEKDDSSPELNNVADEIRRNQNNLVEDDGNIKLAVNEQVYNQSLAAHQQVQYNQHLLQQHMLTHQAQQFQQHQQHFKAAQQQNYSQLPQTRSQEMLVPRPDDQIYYQAAYQGQRSPQRFVQQSPVNTRDQQGYIQQAQSHMQYVTTPSALERQAAIANFERRSAQQLERDTLRQRSFEARRAASQPQLALEDEIKNEIIADHKPQPQTALNSTRRGSYGNIMDANAITQQYVQQQSQQMGQNQHNQQHLSPHNRENEKDSDDGGFLKRTGSKDRHLENKPPIPPKDDLRGQQNPNEDNTKSSSSQNEGLQGTPRKKLEGEIGKIEGVYNVNSGTSNPEEPGPSTAAPSGVKKNNLPSSAASSDYEKATGGQSSSNVDSGRGSAAYSSGRRPPMSDVVGDSPDCGPSGLLRRHYRDRHDEGHDSEWVDIVENELRHILEPKLHELSLHGNSNIATSTVSESISSMTPPLPPLSPGDISSPTMTPKNVGRYKQSSLPYGSKLEYESYKSKHARDVISGARYSMPNQKHRSSKKLDHNAILRGKQIFGLDTTDITSTTTRSLDLESMLDGTESDGDLSTTDARAIRKQLEGLESMYSEVLKLLGVKQSKHGRYQPSDPKFNTRRYGSMSSLPSSSVSSRVPIRDRRGPRGSASDERKKVRDLRGINRRFQRLEAHVVTLARSVAHLSSEMRTQHLMIQEMDTIRQEISTLRAHTNMLNVRSQSVSRAVSSRELPTLANPSRVKKLTKFFGDEPPLLRLFLRKLGYEKYANTFENEKVGMVELPYMTEERLQKMGVPMGPRLRIMQEAQISVCKENTLCIV